MKAVVAVAMAAPYHVAHASFLSNAFRTATFHGVQALIGQRAKISSIQALSAPLDIEQAKLLAPEQLRKLALDPTCNQSVLRAHNPDEGESIAYILPVLVSFESTEKEPQCNAIKACQIMSFCLEAGEKDEQDLFEQNQILAVDYFMPACKVAHGKAIDLLSQNVMESLVEVVLDDRGFEVKGASLDGVDFQIKGEDGDSLTGSLAILKNPEHRQELSFAVCKMLGEDSPRQSKLLH